MFVEGISFILFNIIGAPFIFIVVVTLVLAGIGQSLGIRKLYIDILLKVFEYARNTTTEEAPVTSGFSVGNPVPDSDSDEEFRPPYLRNEFTQEAHIPIPRMRKLSRKKTRHNVISRRDNLLLIPSKLQELSALDDEEEKEEDSLAKKVLMGRSISLHTFQREFELSDVFDYVKTGVAAIIEDEVTQRFVAEDLKTWNLLTRSNSSFQFISWRLTVFYICGTAFRYFIMFPGRLALMVVGMLYMVFSCFCLAWIPMPKVRKWLYERVALIVFQCFSRCFSASITFHNLENRPAQDGICVANHTSPIDVVILSTDRAYALVGQSHGGFMGVVQRTLSRAASHIWFQRAEVKDRAEVARRLKNHVEDPDTLPILIFPEGTCINNTSVMQFKKGSFEVGGVIYPVAIKYDSKFGDAFWNSSRYSMVTYLLMMATSWAIVCDVWYLPPMLRKENEDAIEFANRVKKEIARKGGLVDLVWDGNLKRQGVKSEWKAAAQQQFSRRLKHDLTSKQEKVTNL